MPIQARLSTGKLIRPALASLAAESPQRAYGEATADAARDVITAEELCELRWDFRFKPRAGAWLASIPPMQRTFSPCGRVRFVGPVTAFFVWGATSPEELSLWDFRWEFVVPGLVWDRAAGVSGAGQHLRLRLAGGHRWPAIELKRRPDWGWSAQNDWVSYTATAVHAAPAAAPGAGPCSGGGLLEADSEVEEEEDADL